MSATAVLATPGTSQVYLLLPWGTDEMYFTAIIRGGGGIYPEKFRTYGTFLIVCVLSSPTEDQP